VGRSQGLSLGITGCARHCAACVPLTNDTRSAVEERPRGSRTSGIYSGAERVTDAAVRRQRSEVAVPESLVLCSYTIGPTRKGIGVARGSSPHIGVGRREDDVAGIGPVVVQAFPDASRTEMIEAANCAPADKTPATNGWGSGAETGFGRYSTQRERRSVPIWFYRN
jgi:hypothetical protein